MKKVLAFLTSLSMCLSILTAIAPAFACEDTAEERMIELRMVDPNEKPDKEPDIFEDLEDSP